MTSSSVTEQRDSRLRSGEKFGMERVELFPELPVPEDGFFVGRDVLLVGGIIVMQGVLSFQGELVTDLSEHRDGVDESGSVFAKGGEKP